MSDVVEAIVVTSPPNQAPLAAAFRAWAGADADLRVVFTPDVLIGFDTPTRRGYLFDDGWAVEVWIERGLPEFLDLLADDYLSERCEVARPPGGPSSQRALLELALSKGAPIDEVKDLI